MRSHATRVFLALTAAVLIPACGSSGGNDAGESNGGVTSNDNSGGNSTGSTVPGTANGGAAPTSAMQAAGDVRFGVNPPPAAPSIPPLPTGGTLVTTLAADQTVARGTAIISGILTGSGAASRTITASNGDLVISGTINAGQNAGTQINLNLNAPMGTVFITGSVSTSSVDGVPTGNAAGTLVITARKIVVMGLINASGENNAAGAGGLGGTVTLQTNTVTAGSDILVTGTILTPGGNGIAGAGGAGGTVTITARDDVHVVGAITTDGGTGTAGFNSVGGGLAGSINVNGRGTVVINAALSQNGGSATGTGAAVGAMAGAGGSLLIDTAAAPSGPAFLYGSRSARGGNAVAPSGSAGNRINGGAGGAITVGNGGSLNCPSSLDLGATTWIARGGDSSDVGGSGTLSFLVISNQTTPGNVTVHATIDCSAGKGGNVGGNVTQVVELLATTGDVTFSGSIVARAGDGGVTPGTSNLPVFLQTQGPNGGDVTFSGSADVQGASSTALSSVNVAGGTAGQFLVNALSTTSRIFIQPGSLILASGGASTGTSAGGTGGTIGLFTLNAAATMGGTIVAQGGPALGAGGTGGLGGRVAVSTDTNFTGIGGDITLLAGALIDVSGGSGTVGGNARTGAIGAGSISFDANGTPPPSATSGIVLNQGTIIARGGSPGGNGGDVFFRGRDVSGIVVPLPGNQDRSGTVPGVFTPQ